MLRLTVESFSCIKQANIEVHPLTVLIGPQASGKSVLSKLVYFFIDQVNSQHRVLLDGQHFEDFTSKLKQQFCEWFPTSAWGEGKFKISFEMGAYQIRLSRTSYEDTVKDGIRIWTSNDAKEHFRKTAELLKSLRSKVPRKSGIPEFSSDMEIQWRLREAAGTMLKKDIGRDAVVSQTFIPAGRSFFTTLGRAFIAFDQSKTLDPATLNFGRTYANISSQVRWIMERGGKATQFEVDMAAMLGGELVWQGSEARFKCHDGRVVPFGALSSGQQELLPLVTTLRVLARHSEVGGLVFIEEPEAHLFPESQSKLIEALAPLVNDPKKPKSLFITTHSPYVLSKINNLMKAGQLSQRLSGAKFESLSQIVAPMRQLKNNFVKAYALIDGETHSIVDAESGLIDADYLDSASGRIGEEFSELLDLQYG